MDYLSLKAGDTVAFSGVVYTARDAAHKRITEALDKGLTPPFPIEDSVIYYAGPSPAKPGEIIGSCGPTSSARMDDYTPRLLSLGLKAMIGKGKRSIEVIDAIEKYGAVYFCAVGGAAALYKSFVVSNEPVAYEDLGTEAVRKLVVKDMPLIVGIDSRGNSILK